MEKVFANLYRMGKSNRRGTSYTYFLKRPKGNLLVCHGTPPSSEDLDEIEALGGLDSQWVCHSHDAIKGTPHKKIHERFGAPLRVHRIDRGRVLSKARCEMDPFFLAHANGVVHASAPTSVVPLEESRKILPVHLARHILPRRRVGSAI